MLTQRCALSRLLDDTTQRRLRRRRELKQGQFIVGFIYSIAKDTGSIVELGAKSGRGRLLCCGRRRSVRGGADEINELVPVGGGTSKGGSATDCFCAMRCSSNQVAANRRTGISRPLAFHSSPALPRQHRYCHPPLLYSVSTRAAILLTETRTTDQTDHSLDKRVVTPYYLPPSPHPESVSHSLCLTQSLYYSTGNQTDTLTVFYSYEPPRATSLQPMAPVHSAKHTKIRLSEQRHPSRRSPGPTAVLRQAPNFPPVSRDHPASEDDNSSNDGCVSDSEDDADVELVGIAAAPTFTYQSRNCEKTLLSTHSKQWFATPLIKSIVQPWFKHEFAEISGGLGKLDIAQHQVQPRFSFDSLKVLVGQNKENRQHSCKIPFKDLRQEHGFVAGVSWAGETYNVCLFST